MNLMYYFFGDTVYCHAPWGDIAAAFADMAFYTTYMLINNRTTMQWPWWNLRSQRALVLKCFACIEMLSYPVLWIPSTFGCCP